MISNSEKQPFLCYLMPLFQLPRLCSVGEDVEKMSSYWVQAAVIPLSILLCQFSEDNH
jgi:hypothetical protein